MTFKLLDELQGKRAEEENFVVSGFLFLTANGDILSSVRKSQLHTVFEVNFFKLSKINKLPKIFMSQMVHSELVNKTHCHLIPHRVESHTQQRVDIIHNTAALTGIHLASKFILLSNIVPDLYSGILTTTGDHQGSLFADI